MKDFQTSQNGRFKPKRARKWGAYIRVPRAWLFDKSLTPVLFRHLLLRLALSSESKGSFVSRDKLASLQGLSRRHVARLDTALVKMGYLLKEGRRGRRTVTYRVVAPMTPMSQGNVTPMSQSNVTPMSHGPNPEKPIADSARTPKNGVPSRVYNLLEKRGNPGGNSLALLEEKKEEEKKSTLQREFEVFALPVSEKEGCQVFVDGVVEKPVRCSYCGWWGERGQLLQKSYEDKPGELYLLCPECRRVVLKEEVECKGCGERKPLAYGYCDACRQAMVARARGES